MSHIHNEDKANSTNVGTRIYKIIICPLLCMGVKLGLSHTMGRTQTEGFRAKSDEGSIWT